MLNFDMAIGVAIIVSFIEVAKSLGLNQKLSPLLAMAIGVIVNVCNAYFGSGIAFGSIINGVIFGLTAVGLYSGTKNVIEEVY